MDFVYSIKMHITLPISILFLVLVDVNITAADPVIAFHENREKDGNLCNEHMRLHQRLDVIEEQVEKTVENLYSEMNSLLESLSSASWALPVIPGPPVLDIFEEDSR
ncbi:Hypothetical predicted protein [Pelobates cultripes]|uniref:Placenta-specific protein 9 n=1 Tax=Pelobates cultripes TaxID=61616 RepID=A0AAD1WTN3_PELCU|nr:Hypothetical predicted protein [Pelobates cultripes]